MAKETIDQPSESSEMPISPDAADESTTSAALPDLADGAEGEAYSPDRPPQSIDPAHAVDMLGDV